MIFLKIWVIIHHYPLLSNWYLKIWKMSLCQRKISVSQIAAYRIWLKNIKLGVTSCSTISSSIIIRFWSRLKFSEKQKFEKNVHQKRPCFSLINISSRPQLPCGRWWDASLFTFSFIAVTSWLGSEDEIGGHYRFFDYPISNLIAGLYSAVIAQRLKIERH